MAGLTGRHLHSDSTGFNVTSRGNIRHYSVLRTSTYICLIESIRSALDEGWRRGLLLV